LHGALADALPAEVELLGPAPRLRLRGRHRRQLLIKAVRREAAVDAVRHEVEAVAGTSALRGVALSVDVDPQ
jgi:primosomal protein N'